MQHLFARICSPEFRRTQDLKEFVSERKSIVQAAIAELSQSCNVDVVELEKLQIEIEQLRMLNPSPQDRLRELLPLLEERVLTLESMVRKLAEYRR